MPLIKSEPLNDIGIGIITGIFFEIGAQLRRADIQVFALFALIPYIALMPYKDKRNAIVACGFGVFFGRFFMGASIEDMVDDVRMYSENMCLIKQP